MERQSRPLLRLLNPHLVCPLCSGYLIDATTVRQCLHSFCLSCILPIIQSTRSCPICSEVLLSANPIEDLLRDDCLQKLVYKVVPGLLKYEKSRRDNFANVCKTLVPGGLYKQTEDSVLCNLLTTDDHLSIMLKCCLRLSNNSYLRSKKRVKVIHKWHLCVGAAMTVAHLRKFLQHKLDLIYSRYQISIYSGDKTLQDTDTLMDAAYIQGWDQKKALVLKFIIGCRKSLTPYKVNSGIKTQSASRVNCETIVSNLMDDKISKREILSSLQLQPVLTDKTIENCGMANEDSVGLKKKITSRTNRSVVASTRLHQRNDAKTVACGNVTTKQLRSENGIIHCKEKINKNEQSNGFKRNGRVNGQ